MLQNIDLSRTIDKASFKIQKTEADLKLGELQRTAKSLAIPTVILFEGWSASGKGTLINELILPLDPRGFSVYSTRKPTEEEAFYPFLCDSGRGLRLADGSPSSTEAGTAGSQPTGSRRDLKANASVKHLRTSVPLNVSLQMRGW